MSDFFEFRQRLATNTLRRRVRRDQIRKLKLKLKKLVLERIERRLADRGLIKHVVGKTMRINFLAQFFNARFCFGPGHIKYPRYHAIISQPHTMPTKVPTAKNVPNGMWLCNCLRLESNNTIPTRAPITYASSVASNPRSSPSHKHMSTPMRMSPPPIHRPRETAYCTKKNPPSKIAPSSMDEADTAPSAKLKTTASIIAGNVKRSRI